MKILITGFTGFVSAHFLELLNRKEPGSYVLGIDNQAPDFEFSVYPNLNISFQSIDLLHKDAVNAALNAFNPNYILHLASVSSVAKSWQTPLDSFVNNTNIFLNLVEQVRVNNISCRILSIGSSEEYGEVSDAELPLTEDSRLKPLSPYAVARVSQEMLSKIYADGFGLDIIITRSFNHIGPGQKDNFVISSFAKQLVQLAKNKATENKIITGNVSVIRDFLDVRDVVNAYYCLLKDGRKGEVYNICSGQGNMLSDIILRMSDMLDLSIRMETDPDLIRPNENKQIIGSYQKINRELGWKPEISLDQSLADIIKYWQNKPA
ncbi:MAG: GDP-mannose 4,6-dehydratase [Chitinophagaceae bacterium]|nr:GDP-mannose 4,6-dehydratase [Chitinophagaceae bacterium]